MERENIKLREAHSKMKEKQFNLSKMVYGKGVKASTPVAGAAPKVHKKISPFLEGPAKVHKKLTNIPMHKSRSFRSSSGIKSTFHRKYSASPLNY